MNRISRICFVAVMSFAAALPAQARLFGDSRLINRDNFSDEITGEGPDLVLVTTSAPEDWKDAAKRLRQTHRVHLIHVAQSSPEIAEALDAYFVSRDMTPVTLIAPAELANYMASHHADHVKKAMTAETPQQIDDAALKV